MSFSGMEWILAHELNYDLGSMNKETSSTVMYCETMEREREQLFSCCTDN
jgi:hypothetical protein